MTRLLFVFSCMLAELVSHCTAVSSTTLLHDLNPRVNHPQIPVLAGQNAITHSRSLFKSLSRTAPLPADQPFMNSKTSSDRLVTEDKLTKRGSINNLSDTPKNQAELQHAANQRQRASNRRQRKANEVHRLENLEQQRANEAQKTHNQAQAMSNKVTLDANNQQRVYNDRMKALNKQSEKSIATSNTLIYNQGKNNERAAVNNLKQKENNERQAADNEKMRIESLADRISRGRQTKTAILQEERLNFLEQQRTKDLDRGFPVGKLVNTCYNSLCGMAGAALAYSSTDKTAVSATALGFGVASAASGLYNAGSIVQKHFDTQKKRKQWQNLESKRLGGVLLRRALDDSIRKRVVWVGE